MKTLIFAAMLILAGCQRADATSDLRSQYAMMERAGVSKSELCEQGRKIQQAVLESGDEAAYRLQKMSADSVCLGAKLDRQMGISFN